MRVWISIIVLITATLLLALDVEPVPTWFYVFAWYPVLVVADDFAARRTQRTALLASPALVLSMMGWSVVVWLLYEAANLRLAHWYYVFLPQSQVWRWLGITMSFATVVPAVVLSQRVLEGLGIGRRWISSPVTIRPRDLIGSALLGSLMVILPLARPDLLAPLIWGAGLLLSEPLTYRLSPRNSLFRDIETGRWTRVGQLMVGGMCIGIIWETLNYFARGKWIYTVPFLENLKAFEMPPVGFLGFPIFALSAWSLYHALCGAGVAVTARGDNRIVRKRMPLAVGAAVMFCFSVLSGMERRTISSTVPTLADLPMMSEDLLAGLRTSGIRNPFDLAGTDSAALADQLGTSPDLAVALHQSASLAILRGIGSAYATRLLSLEVDSVCKLASMDPQSLWSAFHRGAASRSFRPTLPEIRVWTRSARRDCSS